VLRRQHYNLRTEQSYVDWIKRFILFHGKRHPAEMGKVEVTAFFPVCKSITVPSLHSAGEGLEWPSVSPP